MVCPCTKGPKGGRQPARSVMTVASALRHIQTLALSRNADIAPPVNSRSRPLGRLSIAANCYSFKAIAKIALRL